MGKKVTTTTTTTVITEGGSGVVAVYVLDGSGSMASLQEQVIDGFNEWLAGVKLKRSVDFVTLAIFNTSVETIYNAVPIDQVQPITARQYAPEGWTALHDGICETVKKTEALMRSRDFEKALVITMTDGHENSSQKNTLQDVRRLIERLEGLGNWTFTFLGATPDAFAIGQQFGIKAGNIQQYEVGASRNVFTNLAVNTESFSKSAHRNAANFLSNVAPNGNLTGEYIDVAQEPKLTTTTGSGGKK